MSALLARCERAEERARRAEADAAQLRRTVENVAKNLEITAKLVSPADWRCTMTTSARFLRHALSAPEPDDTARDTAEWLGWLP